MRKQVIVTINDHEQVVKKMPLGKYAEVFAALKELPKHFESFDSLSTEELLPKIPAMIESALPELAKVVSIATEVPEKEIIEELGIDDITELIIAVLDVNNIERIVDNVKKIMARKEFKGFKGVAEKAKEQVTKPSTE